MNKFVQKLPIQRQKDGSYIWSDSPFRWVESLDEKSRSQFQDTTHEDYPERLEKYQEPSRIGILS